MIKQTKKLKVLVSPTLKAKIDILSSNYDCEIGGYLLGEVINGVIYLKDLLIPEQNVNSSSVNISAIDQVRMRNKYGLKKMKQIIGHWHSHHNMGAWWSDTDLEQHRQKMEIKDFYVFIVSSKAEHLIRIYQNSPFNYYTDFCDFEIHSINIELMKKKVERIFNSQNNVFEKEEIDSNFQKEIEDTDQYTEKEMNAALALEMEEKECQ